MLERQRELVHFAHERRQEEQLLIRRQRQGLQRGFQVFESGVDRHREETRFSGRGLESIRRRDRNARARAPRRGRPPRQSSL